MAKVLVTGAGGQLGREVCATFETEGWDVVACDHAALDTGDREAVHHVVAAAAPDAVVHTAAFTAVDACEAEPERAWRDNALAVRWVAEAASLAGAHLCHVSTDYVFDGTKPEPYIETDAPNPQSVYGQSKLAGEREAGPDATIVRTSWVCGQHGSNMVKTVLTLASDPERTMAFVDDQRGSPSFTADLAPAIHRLVSDRLGGIFHVTNQGSVSWYEFVRDMLVAAGHDPARVRPIATADLDPPRPAPRPANSVLENAALRQAGLPLLPHYRSSLQSLVDQLITSS